MWLALEMQVRENDTVDQNKSRSTEKALLSGNILKSKASQIYASGFDMNERKIKGGSRMLGLSNEKHKDKFHKQREKPVRVGMMRSPCT